MRYVEILQECYIRRGQFIQFRSKIMAFFGIAQQSTALTASTATDTISFFSESASAVASAVSVYGLAGNDLISLAAQGRTAIATASSVSTFTQIGYQTGAAAILSGTNVTNAVLVGSATYTTGNTINASTGVLASGALTASLVITNQVAITGVVTSERGLRQTNASLYSMGDGNDKIYLGNSITTFTSTTIDGGDGNDIINNDSYLDGVVTTANANASAFTAATYEKAFIEGDLGNDSIRFAFTGGSLSAVTFQGGQGNDEILIDADQGVVGYANNLLAGGGGNDSISGQFGIISSNTIAGGGGNDTINLNSTTTVSNLIVGDTFNTTDQFDGSDNISGSNTLMSSTTIQAGAGNDVVSISYVDGGSNLIELNRGNDTFNTDSIVSASTIQGGEGNDTFNFYTGAQASIIKGGGNNDIVSISGAAAIANTTIYGGEGADVLGRSATLAAGITYGATFGYDSYTESTLSAMDTISVNNALSGTFNTYNNFGGLSRGSFATSYATATNGVAIFSATFDNNVTARVAALDSNVTTTGAVILFQDGDRKNYAFIQGGANDLVFQIGTGANNVAITQANSTVTLTNNNKSIAFLVD